MSEKRIPTDAVLQSLTTLIPGVSFFGFEYLYSAESTENPQELYNAFYMKFALASLFFVCLGLAAMLFASGQEAALIFLIFAVIVWIVVNIWTIVRTWYVNSLIFGPLKPERFQRQKAARVLIRARYVTSAIYYATILMIIIQVSNGGIF